MSKSYNISAINNLGTEVLLMHLITFSKEKQRSPYVDEILLCDGKNIVTTQK